MELIANIMQDFHMFKADDSELYVIAGKVCSKTLYVSDDSAVFVPYPVKHWNSSSKAYLVESECGDLLFAMPGRRYKNRFYDKRTGVSHKMLKIRKKAIMQSLFEALPSSQRV